MVFITLRQHKLFRPAMGAALAAVFGLVLWAMPIGNAWTDASYDYLYKFSSYFVTNQVVVILMDNEAYAELGQNREEMWDRSLHTKLFNKLADDGCLLVVPDIMFRKPGDAKVDQALADAIHRLPNVVLAAAQTKVAHPALDSARPTLPLEILLEAAQTNWGVAWLDPDLDMVVRHHWPFPNPGPYPSLSWTAALRAGAHLNESPSEKWIRYYDVNKTWTSLSYHVAQAQRPGYFHGKIVFIGNKPRTSVADGEVDKFQVPQTHWTGETVGGMEIQATEFLNLLNGDWLRRMKWPVEGLLLIFSGIILGGILCQLRRGRALAVAGIAVLLLVCAGVWLSNFTNYWFPWLIVVGGQLPCALAWALVSTASIRVTSAPLQQEITSTHYDLFISVKSEDKLHARSAAEYLRQEGLRVFLSEQQLQEMGNSDYFPAIFSALEDSSHMLVVTTSNANVNSQWVKKEWQTFLNEKLSGRKTGNLVTLLCGNMKIGDLPLSLRQHEARPSDDLPSLLNYFKARG